MSNNVDVGARCHLGAPTTEEETMTPSISFISKEDIAVLRCELLERAGLDLETLRARGAEFRLSPEQTLTLKEIDDLDFLPGA